MDLFLYNMRGKVKSGTIKSRAETALLKRVINGNIDHYAVKNNK